VIRARAVICPKCGCQQPEVETQSPVRRSTPANNDKMTAGLLGILLGGFGVHKFVLGYTGAGMTMLLVCIFGAIFVGLGPLVMITIGIIEGVIYLTMSDADFARDHGQHRRPWF
jgi:TM2 domain-containing membrane protein YozV